MIKERYSIIVASQTDARKKSKVINITRKKLTTLICAAVLIVVTVAGIAAWSAVNAAAQFEELKELEQQDLER